MRSFLMFVVGFFLGWLLATHRLLRVMRQTVNEMKAKSEREAKRKSS